MQVRNWKWCCHIKLWITIKASSILWVFNIIFILVYCGLYTMTIDVVIWRIIKYCAFDPFTCVIFFDCQFLRYFFKKYVGRPVIFLILYIYKIEIRNSETFLPEESVSSIMVQKWSCLQMVKYAIILELFWSNIIYFPDNSFQKFYMIIRIGTRILKGR